MTPRQINTNQSSNPFGWLDRLAALRSKSDRQTDDCWEQQQAPFILTEFANFIF
jgi:hypothetical protein